MAGYARYATAQGVLRPDAACLIFTDLMLNKQTQPQVVYEKQTKTRATRNFTSVHAVDRTVSGGVRYVRRRPNVRPHSVIAILLWDVPPRRDNL